MRTVETGERDTEQDRREEESKAIWVGVIGWLWPLFAHLIRVAPPPGGVMDPEIPLFLQPVRLLRTRGDLSFILCLDQRSDDVGEGCTQYPNRRS